MKVDYLDAYKNSWKPTCKGLSFVGYISALSGVKSRKQADQSQERNWQKPNEDVLDPLLDLSPHPPMSNLTWPVKLN